MSHPLEGYFLLPIIAKITALPSCSRRHGAMCSAYCALLPSHNPPFAPTCLPCPSRPNRRMLTIDDLSARVAGRLLIDGAAAISPDGRASDWSGATAPANLRCFT